MGGFDSETRPNIGFYTLKAKLESSHSLKKWTYIIKNLIILDRCLEERYFLKDIAELHLRNIENYSEKDHKYGIS